MIAAATLRSVAQPRSGRTVLVVDDEPTIAEVVARYLERAGYVTATAGDGLEALRLAAERRPDLIVLDLMLPGLGGLEVLRQLGESDGPRTPVILLTAKGEQDDKLVGLGSGADDYVVKPFSPSELVARVDAVLQTRAPGRRMTLSRCASTGSRSTSARVGSRRAARRFSSASASSTCWSSSLPTPARCSPATS